MKQETLISISRGSSHDGRVLSGILTTKEENLSILTTDDESISFDADNVEKIEVDY